MMIAASISAVYTTLTQVYMHLIGLEFPVEIILPVNHF